MPDKFQNTGKIEEHRQGDGVIPLCPHKNCGFKCCEFQQGNFIVMFPEEVEIARTENRSLSS